MGYVWGEGVSLRMLGVVLVVSQIRVVAPQFLKDAGCC